MSTCRERARRYSGVISAFLKENSSMVILLIYKQLIMVRTEMIRLMTWNRKHFKVFPFGSSIYPMLLTIILIEAPSLLITALLAIRDFHPVILIPIMALLQLASLIALFLCVYTDPGILPQIVDKYAWDVEQAAIPGLNHLNMGEHKYLMVTGQLNTHQKYCVQCYVYRPLRTIHCQACNHCVERYDHHCPWLGVCIGKYNYRYFFIFISVLCCLSASIASVSLAMIFTVMQERPVVEYLPEILLSGAAIFFFLPIFKLFTYHLQLFHSRETTNEDLKGLYHILKGSVPFERCLLNQRPPLVPLKGTMILNVEKEELRSSTASERYVEKGKRYSTLVSDRQSVLNYLVETQL